MSEPDYQRIGIGAAVLALIGAVAAGRHPRWARYALVAIAAALAAGAGVLAYREFTKPRTLTIAAGSLDGDIPRLLSAIAARLSAENAAIRLRVIDKGTVANSVRAFASGEADLVVTRSDIGDLTAGQTMAVITDAIVLLVAPPGSSIESIEDLKGKTVTVIGADANKSIISALSREYELDKAKVQFRDVSLSDAPRAVSSKQVAALLVVMPITAKYTSMLRDLFPKDAKRNFRVIPIDLASAIAHGHPQYESYELPKGSLRGSPPVPDDDLTTMRVPLYLVARKTLSSDVAASLVRGIMEARRALVSEHPLLAQIRAPDTEKDKFIPIHPGAAAYFSGEEKTIFEKYGDQLFYGSMLLGSLVSVLAAAWRFMIKDAEAAKTSPVLLLYALKRNIAAAASVAELAQAEELIDEILGEELERYASGTADPGETAALGLATRRLEYLLDQRRRELLG